MDQEYMGSVYVGVVGPEIETAECRDSIERIRLRQGDTGPHYIRATKGYEARQQHLNKFIESGQDFILMLDQDMYFEPDTLEKLRSHKLPYVSGLYMRRNWEQLAPVWYRKFDGKWPMLPWIGNIPKDTLHEIGASGWGCILIHKDVIMDTREILKGELEVLEDDMDVYPYDIYEIMRAINGLAWLVDNQKKIDSMYIQACLDILQREIKPLRVIRTQIGSDIRFPFYALQAGYQLMGDPNVRPGHNVQFPLNANMYEENFEEEDLERAKQKMAEMAGERRKVIARERKEVFNA